MVFKMHIFSKQEAATLLEQHPCGSKRQQSSKGLVSDVQSNCANDHVPVSTTNTILASRFPHLKYKRTSEQRPPVNNSHKCGFPWMI